MLTLEQLSFDNTFATLPEIFYSEHQPVGLHKDFLIHFNDDIAGILGIDNEEALRDDFLDIFMGRKPFDGFKPLAACYAGHQFGHFVEQALQGGGIMLRPRAVEIVLTLYDEGEITRVVEVAP